MPEGNLHGHMTGLGTLGGHMQGSGTTDYNELNNKPKINNVTLVGNKTSNDLNLQEKINFNGDASTYLNGEGNFTTPAGSGGSYSGLTDKPSINGVELDGNLSLSDLDIQEELDFPGDAARYLNGEGNFTPITFNYDDASNRPEINSHVLTGNQTSDDLGLQDKLPFNSDPNKFLNGAGSFTEVTADYSDLSNKPSIGGVELDGDKSAAQLGLQEVINFPNDPDKYLDGQGNFKKPSYDYIDDRPAINSITLSGDQSGNDLELTSGPIASGSGTSVQFTAEGEYNLLKCEVEFEPVQDLHGYDNPWDGGAGNNKFENTATTTTHNYVTFTVNSDGTITANGTATGGNAQIIIPISNIIGNMKYSAISEGSDSTYNAYIWDNTSSSRAKQWDGSTNVATSTDGTLLQVQLVSGNSYSLICRVMDGTTADNVIFYPMIVSSTETNTDFEPYSNICPISGHSDITINVSPSADPSEGTDTIISLGDTYYGGQLNISTGELTIDMQIVDLGTLTWTRTDNAIIDVGYWFHTNVTGKTVTGETINSNYRTAPYKSVTTLVEREGSAVNYVAVEAGGEVGYRIIDSRYSVAADFKTAMNGVQMCYYLATPISVQLPPEVISSLIGENYISTSDGTLTIDAATEIFDPVLEYLVNHR